MGETMEKVGLTKLWRLFLRHAEEQSAKVVPKVDDVARSKSPVKKTGANTKSKPVSSETQAVAPKGNRPLSPPQKKLKPEKVTEKANSKKRFKKEVPRRKHAKTSKAFRKSNRARKRN